MATITTAARNAACNAVVDLLDAGTGDPTLEIGTSGFASTLLTFTLDGTNAFGSASTGVATATGLPISATAGATGTAAAYRYKDRDGTIVISGTNVTVSGGGGEIEIGPSLSVTSGSSYDLTAATITMPAS
jgi:hypothetical protein